MLNTEGNTDDGDKARRRRYHVADSQSHAGHDEPDDVADQPKGTRTDVALSA